MPSNAANTVKMGFWIAVGFWVFGLIMVIVLIMVARSFKR
jgi:uncharacterized membrane protein (DUF485 family)